MYKVFLVLLLVSCAQVDIQENVNEETVKVAEPVPVALKEENFENANYQTCFKYEKKSSYKLSFSCYQKLSEKNDEKGYYGLANAYYNGRGVLKNIAKAVDNYEKSAEMGNVDAALVLGAIYERGTYNGADNEKAFYWYKKAADADNAKAALAISHLYASGKGVAKDDEQSKYWLMKSAENGFSYAEYLVGKLEYNRFILTKDVEKLQKAKEWLEKASSHGNAEAENLLKAIDKK